MMSTRTWMWMATAFLAGTSLYLSACSSCEPGQAPAPAPTAAAGTPPPAAAPVPPPAMGQGQADADVDELYVDAEADPDEGAPPLEVKFTSTVEDAVGAITYEWDFGDGSPKVTDANPTHKYTKVGDYVVTLKAKDSKGIEGETEIDVTVSDEE